LPIVSGGGLKCETTWCQPKTYHRPALIPVKTCRVLATAADCSPVVRARTCAFPVCAADGKFALLQNDFALNQIPSKLVSLFGRPMAVGSRRIDAAGLRSVAHGGGRGRISSSISRMITGSISWDAMVAALHALHDLTDAAAGVWLCRPAKS